MYFAHHSRPNIFENDAMQNVINNDNNNNNTLHDHFDEITACNMNSNPIKTKQNQKNNDRKKSQHTQPEFSCDRTHTNGRAFSKLK